MPCLGWREHFVPRTPITPPTAQRPSAVPGPSIVELITAANEMKIAMERPEEALDRLRLVFVRELWKLHNELGNIHMDQTLYSLEREIQERMAARQNRGSIG
jgi:hypothetical protein